MMRKPLLIALALLLVLECARGGRRARPIQPTPPPIWNAHAKQFIWPPAFEFSVVAGASRYQFTVVGEGGVASTFDAAKPTASLAPVWKDVPVGKTRVTVEALGKIIGEREFHRAADFNGPYGNPVVRYDQSARIALHGLLREPFMQKWLTTGKPDPDYPLYRYPSKMISGVMSGCAMYARQSPRPEDADEALEIARTAADFLINLSAAAGAPLEYFPPTYHGAKPTERENDSYTMLMSPAEAAQGYLNLFDATGHRRYLDAAARIADTYQKRQLPCGTWYLKVDNRTGEPIAPNLLIPSAVINFLSRMVDQYGITKHQRTLYGAVQWTMENPARTFDWQAQFDDAKVRTAYENLSKHEACEFACYLLQHNRDIALAEQILRFAEDQFVVWEHPPALKARSPQLDPINWFTPCSTEQYAMFEPISGSSAFMIVAYVRAYDVTGKQIYLQKAESLANALTVAQAHHHGRYPTRMIKTDLQYWLNCTVNTARAMYILADAAKKTQMLITKAASQSNAPPAGSPGR